MKSTALTVVYFLAAARGHSICAEAPAVETKSKPDTQIYIRTLPEGAAVTINGKAEGTSPQLIVVPSGATKLTIQVDLKGYEKQIRVVEIQGGRITRVEFQMEETSGAASTRGGESSSPASLTSSRAEERAVWEAVARFARAWAAGDTALMVQLIQKGSMELLVQVAEAREDLRNGLPTDKIRVLGIAGDHALASGPFFASRDPKYKERVCLVFTLAKENGAWLIRDIDLEDPKGLLDEIRRFHYAANPPTLSAVFECRLGPGREGDAGEAKGPPFADGVAEMADLDREGAKDSLAGPADQSMINKEAVEKGMDVALTLEGGVLTLLFFDVALQEVPGNNWEDIKPTDADPGLERAESDQSIPVPFAVQDPAPKPTYVFRTREGSQGILQIAGIERPGQVLLRFRLMEGAGSYLRTLFPGRLEFRIAIQKGSSDPSKPQVSDEEAATLVKDLQARGPQPSQYRREARGWYEISSELFHPQGTIQGEHGGKRYVLLSQNSRDTLLKFWGESKPWSLKQVSASLDAQGHPLMALELDEEGAPRIETLTKAHVGRSLAVLVDDRVLAVAVIRDVLKGGRLQITGLFTLAEAQAIVAVLMEGISH